jgi:hypothetical protein
MSRLIGKQTLSYGRTIATEHAYALGVCFMARYGVLIFLVLLSACHAPVTYLRPGASQDQFDSDYASFWSALPKG